MVRYILLRLIFVLFLILSGCSTAPKHPSLVNAELPEIIRIKDFFFDTKPSYNYKISPDGKKIAWIGEKREKKTIFFKSIGDDRERSFTHWYTGVIVHINRFDWARDSRHILYPLYDANARQIHIYLGDTEKYTHFPRDLTPYSDYSARIQRIIRNDPEHILVDKFKGSQTVIKTSTIDLVRINIIDGEEELIAKNPGDVLRWITDKNGNLRGRISIPVPEKRRLDIWSPSSESWSSFLEWTIDDTVKVLSFTPDNGGLYLLSDRGRDRVALVRIELDTTEETLIFEDPQVDIARAFISRAKGTSVSVISYPNYKSIHLLDPDFQDILDAFESNEKTALSFSSIDDEERILTLVSYSDKRESWYLFDRDTGEKTLLSQRFDPEFEELLTEMKPISFKSRDGLIMNGYLTLPKGISGKNLPMVLYVHGGPWRRDYWGYNRMVQLLANRGYAVLQVNFRGSSGYGRAHQEAAKGEFAGKMHTDLIDGVNWAIDNGIADPARIGILGFSYGGYAALVGLAFTPDVFACGVSINGPSNLISLIESKDIRQADYKVWYKWHRYVGDPSVPEDREKMKEKSPFFNSHRIHRPVLIIQGEKDQRVPRRESDEIVRVLKEAKKEVKYVLLRGESHVIRYRSHFFRACHEIEVFLAKHLGGRWVFMDGEK